MKSSTLRSQCSVLDIDRTKCKSLGVPLNDAFQTLQTYLGGYYVNDFNQFGRTWQVNLQADADFRMHADDIRALKVRNNEGKMVPLGTLATVENIGGPIMITRYNMYPAAPINGGSLPGVSSGDMIAAVERATSSELSGTMQHEWTELTYLQLCGPAGRFAWRRSGNATDVGHRGLFRNDRSHTVRNFPDTCILQRDRTTRRAKTRRDDSTNRSTDRNICPGRPRPLRRRNKRLEH